MEEWNITNITDLNDQNKQDLYETFLDGSRFWIQKVLLPLVVTIGIIGNGVTVVVLTRRRMRSSTNTYLTALAISDLLYLIFVFTLSLEHYPNNHSLNFYHYWAYYRFGIWFVDATTSVSTWLTVAFTVERYIAVCHPMRGKMLCTESRARIANVVVYLFGFLATASTPFEWQVTVKNITTYENGNETQTIFVDSTETDLVKNNTYTTAFSWFWSITFVFLPLLLLGIFNSFLIFAVHNSKKKRCKMTQTDHATSTQRQENKITITLIAVVILFMICQIPTAIMFIVKSVYKSSDYPYLDAPYRILGNIFNFLVTINAAANFLLYCAFSARYRRTLLSTFFGRCYRLSSPAHSTITTPEPNHLKRGASRSTIRSIPEGRSTSRSFYISEPKNGIVNRQSSSLYVPKTRNNADMYK